MVTISSKLISLRLMKMEISLTINTKLQLSEYKDNLSRGDNMSKTITFTDDEEEFLYNQLLARKYYFNDDMKFWTTKNDNYEIQRCQNAMSKIDVLMLKILNG